MAKFRLLVKPSAVREIEAIAGKKDRRRVIARIQALADEPRPRGAVKLSGQERYRLRQGRYRVIYEIEDADLLVRVVKVGHRREVYR